MESDPPTQPVRPGFSGFEPVREYRLPAQSGVSPHRHIDIGGSYRLLGKHGAYPAVDFLARINNITDERYMDVFGFPALGINALVGLRATY